jgi:plasmid stabilization system protein ParE
VSFFFHPAAEEEFYSAANYYLAIDPLLGRDFVAEVFAAIARAIEHPHAWTTLEGPIRRSLVRRFPYGVLYSEETDGIYVLAVMHLHREPSYWKERK